MSSIQLVQSTTSSFGCQKAAAHQTMDLPEVRKKCRWLPPVEILNGFSLTKRASDTKTHANGKRICHYPWWQVASPSAASATQNGVRKIKHIRHWWMREMRQGRV